MRKVASAVFSKFAKPLAKKALQSGISHAGDKLGKKAAEKIWRFDHEKTGKYENWKQKTTCEKSYSSASSEACACPGESSEEILNRLISGQGVKRNNRI